MAWDQPEGAWVVTSVARRRRSVNKGLHTKKPKREPGAMVWWVSESG